jgi:hypothetical protein
MNTVHNNDRLIYLLVSLGIPIIISFFTMNHDSNATTSVTVVGENRNNNLLDLTKNIVFNYNGAFSRSNSDIDNASPIITMIQPISFVEDTLFPQSFVSNPGGSDITLANGIKLEDRPITLTVNKIQSNNTITLSLHTLNDKYLLIGDLKGPAKLLTNSTADNALFSLKGNINLNKNTSHSVTGTLAESKSKGLTLTINDAQNPNNFKATIGFSPPHSEGPLAE